MNGSSASELGAITTLGAASLKWQGKKWMLPAKAVALIAWLSVQPGAIAPRNRIRDLLWGESRKADANLRQTLVRVRRLEQDLGATVLLAGPHRIGLNTENFRVDLAEVFSVDVRELITDKRYPQLEFLVDLAFRDPLEGLVVSTSEFEVWRSEIHSRLRRSAVTALTALINDADVQDDRKREGFARKLLDLDSTAEVGYRVLMEIHAKRKERALALHVYRRCRTVLRDELGIEPEVATRDLAVALGFYPDAQRTDDQAAELRPRGYATGQNRSSSSKAGSGIPRIVLFPPLVVVNDEVVTRVATALLEDVTSGLSRCRSFIVIAPYTSQRIEGVGLEADVVRECLNISYSVSTTVKPAISGLAVVFRLTDCESGIVLWSSEFPFSLDNLPILFSQLSHRVTYSLANAVECSELRVPVAAHNTTAYRLYLEGRAAMSGSDLPKLRSARNWYRKSINQSESFAPAFAGVARTLSMERLVRGLTDRTLLEQALTIADRAVELDPIDGRGMRERGFSCLYLKRHDDSLHSFQRASELNSSDADLFADYADALAHSGMPREGLAKCLWAMALNPTCPDYYHWILGSIYFQLEDFQSALRALDPVKHHPQTARLMAASSALAGNRVAAHHYADIVRENYPDFSLDHLQRIIPDKNVEDTDRLIEGLRLAGIA